MRTRWISAIVAIAGCALFPGAASASPVLGLYHCHAGQRCVYGALGESFPTYGNTYPQNLQDCIFAAAADWEQIVLGIEPDPTSIGYDFAQAGGTEAGLSQQALWTYWREPGGIEGYVLTGLSRFSTSRRSAENAVLRYGALLVELRFSAGWGFGPYRRARPGAHEVVLDGFTPVGPLVITWGETLQMSWEQWAYEARGMWALSAAPG